MVHYAPNKEIINLRHAHEEKYIERSEKKNFIR
jgi:hypothetical protein